MAMNPNNYAKYATPTERNELEERHRAGLCDFACPICQAEIDDITASNLEHYIGSRARDIDDMAGYLDNQGALDFCTCGHHYNVHYHPPITYGNDGYEEERWNLKCSECGECENFTPKE